MLTKNANIRLPMDLYKRIKKEAQLSERKTLTNQVVYLLKKALNADDSR